MKSNLINIENDKIVFRNHPISVIRPIITLIILAIAILINIVAVIFKDANNIDDFSNKFNNTKKFIQNLNLNNFTIIVGIVVFVIVILLLILRSYLVWKNTTIIIDNTNITLKKYGLFFKANKCSLIKDISNVNLNSSLLLTIINVKKVCIDINSAVTATEEDYTIYLDTRSANYLKDIIYKLQNKSILDDELINVSNINNDDNEIKDKNTNLQDIISQNASANNKLGNNTGYTFTKKFGEKDLFLHCIFNSLNIFKIVFLSVLVIVSTKSFIAIPFIIFESISILNSIFKEVNKFYGFNVSRSDSHLHITYGLLDKKDFVIPIKNIISIGSKQSFLARIFKYKIITLDAIGYGNKNEESEYISLYMKNKYISKYTSKLLPEIPVISDNNIQDNNTSDLEYNNSTDEEGYNIDITLNKTGQLNFIKKPNNLFLYYMIKSVAYIFVPSIVVYYIFQNIYILMIAAICSIVIPILVFNYTQVAISKDRIVLKKGIVSKNIDVYTYKKIDLVTLNASIINKKMGVASFEFGIKDSKSGKTTITTGLFPENIFDPIIKFYADGEK